jgi:NAD(P)-dependent dehydrogenase (short-subunit alcohol dehydrogenase family)
MSLQGKNVIITGATSGFGVQIASVLSAEGASVFIGGRRADRGEKVAKDTNSTFHVVDVADQESNQKFFAAAEKHFGGQNVDFILLNAGVEGDSMKTHIPTVTVETYDYIFSVNVRGIILGVQYGTPLMRNGGTFVFTSSAGSILPFSGNPVYGASKAAVDSLVRSYAAQLADSQDERITSLSMVSINPTLYSTELSARFVGDLSGSVDDDEAALGFAKSFNPSQRMGHTEELAVIVRDFVQGKLPYKSGDTICADADTHFPLSEYLGRMQAAQEGITQEQ